VSPLSSSSELTRPAEGGPGARETIELVALIIAPATLLTALLFYFGWARSRAQAAYFGIDSDVLGRSSQDYMLRSVGSIFWPLALLLVGILLALFAHSGAKRLATSGHARLFALVAGSLIAAGAILVVVGVLGVVWRPRTGGGAVLTPAVFALGIPAAAYGLFLAASSGSASNLAAFRRAPLLMVAGLSALFAFWAIGNYADFRGRTLAGRTAKHVDRLPSVIVYSPDRLYLEGLGVEEKALTAPHSAYRFRYSGLRLLARAGTRTFLLPQGWCRQRDDVNCKQNGVTFMLRDDDAVRLDFAR
jgi:hypothetical protein